MAVERPSGQRAKTLVISTLTTKNCDENLKNSSLKKAHC